MGFMGFGDFTKEGPGVDKNAPKKRRFFQFLDLLREKFGKLTLINLLFCAFAAVCGGMFYGIYVLTNSFYLGIIGFIPLFIPICALSKLTKKIACDEPVFIFSDFFDALAENWKQALLIGIIDYPFAALFSLIFFYLYSNFSADIGFVAASAIAVLFALYFCFMQIYLPLFAVTFELDFVDLIKNAAIFSVVNIKSNFITTITTAVIAFLIAFSFELVETPIYSGIAIVVMIVIGFSFISFTANFSAWPKVYELLVKPNIEQDEDEEETAEENYEE